MRMAGIETVATSARLSEPADRPSVGVMLRSRAAAVESFFSAEADRIARLCSEMADRFTAGGRLIAAGVSPSARSDVRHVAVEFVHPVIVGKRALPALGLAGDGADVAARLSRLAGPRDTVIMFGGTSEMADSRLVASLAACGERGCLTIAFDSFGADAELRPDVSDEFARQECVETTYHVLWELVHVFFEHGPDDRVQSSDPGQSAFLYPFLTAGVRDRDAIVADVSRSILCKAADVTSLRAQMLDAAGHAELIAAATAVRERLAVGGKVLAFGNGGSATDAMDLVADLSSPPRSVGLAPRRAIDLTEDPAILTALANDVGPDVMFARQVSAFASDEDVVVAFSTSGSSRNVVAALEAARRRGALTVAFTGYDGGRVAADGLADHVLNAPSQYIPRIQEAHATGYHLLRQLVG